MSQLQSASVPHTKEAIHEMLHFCSSGDIASVQTILERSMQISNPPLAASLQDEESGISPLMAASEAGQLDICKLLLEKGAPWNAVDRFSKCAGNYATEKEHWDVINLLVDHGTKSELILGATIRNMMKINGINSVIENTSDGQNRSIQQEPCTKPDYLHQNVRYNAAETALLDEDNDAVMMEWERPLMEAHASIITGNSPNRTILNVGFGMGIIDSFIQTYNPALHVIIEAHPIVYQKMIKDGWDKKPNVRICFGKWQDELPKLMSEGITFDGMFYDTYGEHFTDLEDFHNFVSKMLKKPGGVYSFFNGLAPDNLFFHGVACQCVKLQLAEMGLDSEFAVCQIQVKENEWDGVRRKYWHGRDTYYLPIITWNNEIMLRDHFSSSVTTSSNTSNVDKRTIDPVDMEGEEQNKRRNLRTEQH